MSSAAPRWHVPAGTCLLRKSWGDEVVVFNTASGQTHVLDALSAAILEAIEASPASVDMLAHRFGRQLGLEPAACARRLEIVCEHFDELGLIAPEPS